jgi:hypothetical protein
MPIKHQIEKHYVTLSSDGDYDKEINLVRWGNEKNPKIEIRDWADTDWSDDGKFPGLGIRFNKEEALLVKNSLEKVLEFLGNRGNL